MREKKKEEKKKEATIRMRQINDCAAYFFFLDFVRSFGNEFDLKQKLELSSAASFSPNPLACASWNFYAHTQPTQPTLL